MSICIPCTVSYCTIPLAFRRARVCVCLVGFASIAIVVVCGRCVLHRLFATTCKHPCLKPLGVHFRHPCLFMNALLALRPAKPLGVHFRHPCLACPSRRTEHQHYRNPAIFSPSKNIVHNLTIAVIHL